MATLLTTRTPYEGRHVAPILPPGQEREPGLNREAQAYNRGYQAALAKRPNRSRLEADDLVSSYDLGYEMGEHEVMTAMGRGRGHWR